MKLNAASTIQKAKNRALAAVVITRYETHGDFKHKSSEGQNCTKSTRTELLNLCQSQFGAIRRMYHELREKEAALQNVEDPNMRAELEAEFEEESASTNRHTIGVMRLIGKLFVWKMITLCFLKKVWLRWGPIGPDVLLPCTQLQSYYLDLRHLSLESYLHDVPIFS
ncbi:hypothetical protein T01_11719 [Trichinella spiralis]|uniref:Uncharacterized protein n=1 Tax=Trichinella spiralis TaxID=6334 RepID=A0A0V1AMF6_TRISP|nr:hypothetical protein T01_11719 [Trichinella spiralis]